MSVPRAAHSTVLIRADASARIGIGHIRRCLVLARALVHHGCVVRFAVGGDAALAPLLAEFWADAIRLAGGDDTGYDQAAWTAVRQQQDFGALLDACGAFCPDWVVVDHYGLGADWHSLARTAWNSAVLAIDDLANRPLAADILVDQNWDQDHRTKYRGRLAPATTLLGGPRYALIDEKFSAEPRAATGAVVASIGIFMGGTDPAGINGTVLQQLRETGFAGPVEIVSTSLNPGLADVRSAVAKDGMCDLTLDLPDLFEFFRRHDFFILAAGGTTWERMASAAPAVAIVTAANQRAIADQLSAEGLQWTVTAGDLAKLSDILLRVLPDAAVRLAMGLRGRTHVDGRGGERVALAMLTYDDAAVTVRRADMNDTELVFEWRNDPGIRAVSRNSGSLDPGAHRAWFAATIASSDRLLLVGEKSGVPVGTVRFDRQGDATFEISIFVSPMLLGLHLGGPLMAAAQAELAQHIGRDIEILAETLPDNRASQQLFLRAGYQQDGNRFRLLLSPPLRLSVDEDKAKG